MRAIIAVLAALVVAGCGGGDPQVVATSAPTAAATETSAPPPSSPSPSASPTSPTEAATQTVDVYFAREGPRSIFVEPVTVPLDEPTPAVARAALEHLLRADPDDPGLTNLVPDGTRLRDVDLDGETLVVDLELPDGGFGLGSAAESAAVAQIVHTGAQFATVEHVRLLASGEPLETGHADYSDAVEPDEFAVSPIVVATPEHGETVAAGDVTVAGTANVFEATVGLRLVGPDGDTVTETFTTATCGTGCRGTWEHTFTGVDEPGTWTVVATEDDASGGEGGGPFAVERAFTVR